MRRSVEPLFCDLAHRRWSGIVFRIAPGVVPSRLSRVQTRYKKGFASKEDTENVFAASWRAAQHTRL